MSWLLFKKKRNAAMNMRVAISFQVTVLFSLANSRLWSPDLYTLLRRRLVHSSVYHQHWAGGVSLVAEAVKNLLQGRRPGFSPWFGKMPWRRKWQPAPVFLPKIFHGQRSLAVYSPRGYTESDVTEQLSLSLHFHFEQESIRRGVKCSFPIPLV